MISDALVEEVRARADILDICSEYVQLKRVGKTHRGPCPLHGGEGPNFSVDPTRGIFKCFVCGEGGDVFSFLMKLQGVDFPTAVRALGERVGVDIPERDEGRADPYAYLREVVAFAEEWFVAQLLHEPSGQRAREYLEGRGISLETAERYALGRAPDEWRALLQAARLRGIEEPPMVEAGLVARSERSQEPYDFFRDRLMFSIRDLRDRPVAFGGRAFADGSGPKYINSPDSPIFHKGKTLYAINWARHPIRREERAILVEGYMDALSLHAVGIETAIAPLGTALTDEQASTLARYAKRAYLLYDSDAAGLRASFRAADTLLAAGVHPLIVTLPPGEDPDSIARSRGASAVREFLGDAVDAVDRKLQILERQGYLDNPEGRRRALDAVVTTIRATRDEALRDIYINRVSERTGVRRETVVHQVAEVESRRRRRERPASTTGTAKPEPIAASALPPGAERNLVLLLLRDESLVSAARRAGVLPEHFKQPGYRAIFAGLVESAGRHGAWSELFEPAVTGLVETLLADDTELTHPAEIFEESVKRVVSRPLLDRKEQIDVEFEFADEEQQRRLLIEKDGIVRRLRELGIPLSLAQRWSQRGATTAGQT